MHTKVGIPIAIFLRSGAELSDKIVEVINEKKMTSEIGLCCNPWKYRSKISLPHTAHLALHCYWNSNLKIGFKMKVK
jgi:hypothetical protein